MSGNGHAKETILEEAQRLVYGDRQQAYGHPFQDFERAGRMIGAVLGIADVPPEKVALIMQCIKISREVHAPRRDNRTDGCGYWAALQLVIEERDRRRFAACPALPDSEKVAHGGNGQAHGLNGNISAA